MGADQRGLSPVRGSCSTTSKRAARASPRITPALAAAVAIWPWPSFSKWFLLRLFFYNLVYQRKVIQILRNIADIRHLIVPRLKTGDSTAGRLLRSPFRKKPASAVTLPILLPSGGLPPGLLLAAIPRHFSTTHGTSFLMIVLDRVQSGKTRSHPRRP